MEPVVRENDVGHTCLEASDVADSDLSPLDEHPRDPRRPQRISISWNEGEFCWLGEEFA